MEPLFTTFHAGGVMPESMQEAFENLLYWVPSGLILLYVMIKNNAWQRALLHLGSLLVLSLMHLLLYPLWGVSTLSFPSLFVSLLFLITLLMWSGRTLFTTGGFLVALCFLYSQEVAPAPQLLAYGCSALLTVLIYVVTLILSKRFELEQLHYVSGEYSSAGYLISDINLFLLFLYATLFAVVMTAVYAFMGM